MKADDFGIYGVTCISADEVEGTGALLSGMNVFLFTALQRFDSMIEVPANTVYERPWMPLSNGMNSGGHKASWHPKGLAIDIAFLKADVEIYTMFKHVVDAGFKGIGVYWNGTAYSMHLDLRPHSAYWSGHKVLVWTGVTQEKKWKYTSLFRDPKQP